MDDEEVQRNMVVMLSGDSSDDVEKAKQMVSKNSVFII